MNLTQRPVLQSDLLGAIAPLATSEIPIDCAVRAVFTRQPLGPWTFYIAQCGLGGKDSNDHVEAYRQFAFVKKQLRHITVRSLLEALSGAGIEMPDGLPSIQLPKTPLNWNEQIVPSHAAPAGMPLRRFTASIQPSAFFPNEQLVDYTLPYRPSAAGYTKEFLGFKAFHDSRDGRSGEFAIEVPDRRGMIHCGSGVIRIKDATTPLRLVGALNGTTSVDLRSGEQFEYDQQSVREIELWLVTAEGDVVDFVSSTQWPHKYQNSLPARDSEQRLLALASNGESETCEFKPYVDLASTKASELEIAVCAFSNQRGGTLFLGISDEGDIVGLARELARHPDHLARALDDYKESIRTRLRESLKDNQCFDVSIATVSGTSLVIVEVREAQEVNYIVRSALAQTPFIRHGATSFKMSPPEIKAKLENSAQSILRSSIFSS